MLTSMIREVAYAKNEKEKQKALRNLERVGMDIVTATIMAAEIRKEDAKKSASAAK